MTWEIWMTASISPKVFPGIAEKRSEMEEGLSPGIIGR
jgi:hypothetical protein